MNGGRHSRTRRAASGTATSILQYIVLLGMQVILAPIVLRTSGQETLGAYSILFQLVAFVSLVDLGFGVALNRFLAQAASVDGQLAPRFVSIFSIGRTYYLASNTVAALILVSISFYSSDFLRLSPSAEYDFRIGLILFAVWSILRSPLGLYGAALTATQFQSAANLSAVAGNVVRLIVSVGLLLSGWGLTGLVIANVATEATTMAAQRFAFRRRFPNVDIGWGLRDQRLVREIFRFGGATFLLTLGSRLTYSSDSIIVGWMFGGATASVFYSTQMPAFMAFTIIFRLAASAEPAINELVANRNSVALQSAYLRLMRYTFIAASMASLGLVLMGRPLITLWLGPDQFAGYAMLLALAAFVVLVTLSNIDYVYLIARGSVGRLGQVAFAEGLLNVALSIALASWIGFQGVMIASLFVVIPRVLYQSIACRSFLEMPIRTLWRESLLVVIPAMAVAGAVFVIMNQIWNSNTWFGFVSLSFVYSCAFLLVAFRFALTTNEQSWISSQFVQITRLTSRDRP